MYLIYFLRFGFNYLLSHHYLVKGKKFRLKRIEFDTKDRKKAIHYGRKMVKNYNKCLDYQQKLDDLRMTIYDRYPFLKD